jgi:hypothetical protein
MYIEWRLMRFSHHLESKCHEKPARNNRVLNDYSLSLLVGYSAKLMSCTIDFFIVPQNIV